MKPIAIFNNGPIRRSERGFYDACGGDHDVLFATACGLPVERMLDIDVEHGDPLPDPAGIAGVILTGSTANITERRPWVEAEAAWVRRNRGSVPMLGVCFGHQLLSHALGGHVDWTPSGPEYGTIDVMGETAASGDPVFTGFPTSITVQSAHCQTWSKRSDQYGSTLKKASQKRSKVRPLAVRVFADSSNWSSSCRNVVTLALPPPDAVAS